MVLAITRSTWRRFGSSSAGFTAPAIAKAKQRGIDLRELKDFTEASDSDWRRTLTIETTHRRSQLKGLTILVPDPFPGAPLVEEEMSKLSSSKGDGLVFVETRSGARRTAIDIWRETNHRHPIWKEVPEVGREHVHKIAPIRFPQEDNRLHIEVGEIKVPIVGLNFHVELWFDILERPFTKFSDYVDSALEATSEPIASAAQTDVEIENLPVTMTVVRTPDGAYKTYLGPGDLKEERKPPRRNSPCPCGSGTKFKKCHGKN